jgi:benzoyl-CoA reductase/2-hydroxyglutaryl-CoA dehydratase subunit BcrC/BadD/HgdB
MNYFYEIYKELYGNRAKELAHHKKNGKKVIGIMCNFVPLELIIAADAIPIRLASGFQEPILPAEEILPRNFCPLIKSCYGMSLMDSPHIDLVDLIIVPTTCDGKKKLAEIFADSKPTWVLEVPHTNETPQARQLWLTELQLLKKQLEELTGNKITTKKLRQAIELVNRKRAVARRLFELRRRTPPPIWGRDAMLVTNLALYDDIKRWTERTEVLCNELSRHKPVCGKSNPRIMLSGSPTVFPTWKIPILVEDSGGIIVMDDVCTGSKELWDPIETAYWTINDMIIAIADKYLMNTCACFTPNLVRVDRIVQFASDFEVDGVIYHVLQACHIYGMEQQRIEKALERVKVPVLNIETDYSQEDVEQIRTRVEAFLEMVSIRKQSKYISKGSISPTAHQPQAPMGSLTSSTPTPQIPIPPDSPIAPAAHSIPKPVSDPIPKPVSDPIPKPVSNPTPQPVSDPTPQPVSDPTPQPVSNPTPQPVSNPTPQPVSDPVIGINKVETESTQDPKNIIKEEKK